jgi:hypothetical protein
MPIQLDFILHRLVEMVDARPERRTRQPWQAAHAHEYGWLSEAMTEHYAGDDTKVTKVRTLAAGMLAAYEGTNCSPT